MIGKLLLNPLINICIFNELSTRNSLTLVHDWSIVKNYDIDIHSFYSDLDKLDGVHQISQNRVFHTGLLVI